MLANDDEMASPRAVDGADATLEGVVERITFSNEESAFSVIKLSVPTRREPVTVVGSLLGVQPGETLRLTGSFEHEARWGEQFRAISYVTVEPSTLVGIEKYLGSGLVPGLGKVMARRIVERFGLATLDVIEREPARLAEVEGIGPKRSRTIQAAWTEQRAVKDVMVFLQSHGVSTAFAIRIYQQYRERAIAVVRENPYRLALDVAGIGFASADKIAASLGVAKDAPARADAGVLHVLGELADRGNVGAPRETLVGAAAGMLDVDPKLVEAAIDRVAAAGRAVVEPALAEAGDAVFLTALHDAEVGAAALVRRLVASAGEPLEIDVDRALAWVEERAKIALAPLQREAIRAATTSKLLVVTGGPGTGKTTIVNGIVRILEKKGRRIALAAPTGRAAKRMTEATGREARTLHRLLAYSPKTGAFERDESSPLEADVIIVDETSMLDVSLAHALLRAVPPSASLVLVGDVDQLPSVGPGNVLADVIRSGAATVVRLATIFRQAAASAIVKGAHQINAGELPAFSEGGDEGDFFFVERDEPDDVVRAIEALVRDRIPRRFALDAIDDVQVLTPMHRGSLGAAALNAALQAALNPRGPELVRGSRVFRVGDKVMQLRNDYDLDVFNGDLGRVARVDDDAGGLVVSFDGRDVAYEAGDLDNLTLAYACSIHKSQGSEYPAVVLPISTQHYVMLQRNLLYTGVTRGKRLVVLVGSKRALALAVGNARVAPRFSELAERIAGRAVAPPALRA